MTYDMPRFDMAELRKVTEPDETMGVLMDKNTQLPEGLPNRIRPNTESSAGTSVKAANIMIKMDKLNGTAKR